MSKHKFSITISGSKEDATTKANALAELARRLDAATLHALADVVKNDPEKVAMARKFLGV